MAKTLLRYTLSLVGIAALVAVGILSAVAPPDEVSGENHPKQKGVCWVGGRDRVTDAEIARVKACGVNWISQTPFGWQSGPSHPEVRFDSTATRAYWGETREGIEVTTRLARQQSISTMLKPHLWVRNSWPGEIRMSSPEDWEQWFSHYSRFMLYYARMAEANGIEMLCIGTELTHSVGLEAQWRTLIRAVRGVYSGKLIYAANFDGEYDRVAFWDALDYIGIQAYFPVADKKYPDVGEMTSRWGVHLKKVERLSSRYSKPVIFTEIGYKSTADAAVEPWLWPQHSETPEVSNTVQADCYEAFFQAAWKKRWLAGTYFWKWYPHGKSRLQDIDFTPQGKPAEQVMTRWFNQPNP